MAGDRKEISLGELQSRARKQGANVALADVQVEGVAVIRDKDGNIKGKMKITSIEVQEDQENADCNGTS